MATKTRKTPAAPAPTTTAAPALQFISLENIRADRQVRTVFNEEQLQELADSIKQQGLLQPVLLRPDPNAIGSFIIIAGERRVRAAHLAGLSAVPALIGDTDEAKADEMQLVENIQREELSLADTAAAVLGLYQKHQRFAPIVELTGKSMAWVSKHITAATKLGFRARMLLDSGKTEDLELILTVSQIEATGRMYPRGDQLVDLIEEGKAGRTEARELLAVLKEEVSEAEKKKRDAKKAAKKSGSPAPKQEREWSPYDAMSDLHNGLMHTAAEHFDLDALLSLWDTDQAEKMCGLVRKSWTAGNLVADASKLDALRALARWTDEVYSNTEAEQMAAFTLGASDIALTLRDLTIEWKAIVNP